MRSVLVASLLATGAFMGGCDGDDGLDGQDGAAGPPGPPGPVGPPGPEGPPAVGTTKPLESCAVCHDEGSVFDAVEFHALTGEAQFSNVQVAANGNNLVISFKVLFNGAVDPSVVLQRVYRQYEFAPGVYATDQIYRDTVPTSPNPVVFVYNTLTGEGVATIEDGNLDYGAAHSTYLVRMSGSLGSPRLAASFPDAAPVYTAAVSDDACQNCHGGVLRGAHNSNPSLASNCFVCHGSTEGTSDAGGAPFLQVVHGIHNSHNMPSGEYEFDPRHIFSVTYPTYMTNCSVCHDSEATLDAANAMAVTTENCFSCHESIEGFGSAFEDSGTLFHEDFDETTDCTICHNDVDGIAAGVITAFHNGLVTERGGIIWDGEDSSVVEGSYFDWQITDVVDNGTTLAISWSATYKGDATDPCNATVGANAPVFHGDGAGNLSVLYAYAQGEDPILGTANAPGQSSAINVTTANTTCAAGVATTTVTPARLAGATRARIALQGKPRVVSIADATATQAVRAKTPVYDFVVGSGDPASPRREVVDTTQCLKCHVGSLYQHGGNRVDNVEMCILCHNSASTEQNVRLGMGVDASEAYDGKVGQTFEMKTMLHAVHSAGTEGSAPIVIYRNRGIYAWATSRDLLPNWPGEGSQIVYGSNNVTQVHNFHTPTYPRALNDCAACHADDFSVIPDQTKAMATTLDAGMDPWTNQIDDVLQGAGAAACTSCHSDAAAKGHAYQNGWTPQAFPNGRQTIIDATN